MTSGRCATLAELPDAATAIVHACRRAVFTTLDAAGHPQPVPVVFVVTGDEIVMPVDDKPKSGRRLAREQNVLRNPRASLLLDRWNEDWTDLGWVKVAGRAAIRELRSEVAALRDRYPQYDDLDLSPGTRGIYLAPTAIRWWTWDA